MNQLRENFIRDYMIHHELEPRWGLNVVREYFQSIHHGTRHRLWLTFSERLEAQFSPTETLEKASNEIEKRNGRNASVEYLDDHDFFNTDMELCVTDGVLSLWSPEDPEERVKLYERILQRLLLLKEKREYFDLSDYKMESFSLFSQKDQPESAVLDLLRSISKQAARSVWKHVYRSSYDFAHMESQGDNGFKNMRLDHVVKIFESMWRNAGSSLDFPGDVTRY